MSAPTRTPAEHEPKAERSRRRERARTAGLIILAVLLTLFAVLNLDRVKVNWIFGSGHAPLIIVIVVSVLIGVVLTRIAEQRARRR
jgi:uncharacterized integral membrane protein